jgi:anti-sigma B factor antagonist
MSANLCEAVVRRHDGTSVVDLSGDINRTAEATLNSAYEEAIADNETEILLNFTDVGYINSTGIAVIVGLLARSRKEGRTVSACGLSEHYKAIFEITRLSDFMTIFTDEEAAVGETPTPA